MFRFLLLAGLLIAGGAPSLAQAQSITVQDIFDRLDRNQDGTLTPDEIQEPQQALFQLLLKRGDTNGDQQLTREEFLLIDLQSAQGDNGENKEVADKEEPVTGIGSLETLRHWDRNGDGELTRDEVPERAVAQFEQILARLGRRSIPIAILVRVNAHASPTPRGTGTHPLLQPGDAGSDIQEPDRPPRRPRGPAFLLAFDVNGDGMLSREELSQAVKSFDVLDRNQDGQLDLGELLGFPTPVR